jgi:hypothetical protein
MGLFSLFLSRPGVHRRSGAMPGPGHEIVGASRFSGPIDPTATHHAPASAGVKAGRAVALLGLLLIPFARADADAAKN